MDVSTLDRRRGGIATLAGYLVVLAALFRDPSRVLDAVNTFQGALFFLAFPLAGLGAGVYAARGGPFSGVGLFVAGSYLVVFVLAVAAVLAGFRALWTYLQSGLPEEGS